MDVRIASNLLHDSLKAFVGLLGRAAPASSVLEYPGIVASLVPDTPERSIFNSVVYDQLDQLESVYLELDRHYVRAGVRAWTVWLMPGADATALVLQQHGHKFDGAPIAMARDLTDFSFEIPAHFDWAQTKNLGTVATLNEEAYGLRGSSFRAALRRMDDPGTRFYIARVSGEPMSSVMLLERDGNCGVYCVATLPSAQAQGLSSTLISIALNEARQRGCTTATVQAMPKGYTVFHKLGFEDLGKMALWELRR
jgi:GNAT superfamily N-acetyltransferase